ncbi:hypothetical protein LBMAG27_08930 [Bacteroidota bacterium]|nr:hypothetical protein LBMAG27_08930 [Bacteroidota bacterium]
MKTILIALVASIGIFGRTTNTEISGTDNFNFTSNTMNFELTIPMDLKNKLVINETENSVVFNYDNPGYPNDVFLFSINKVSEKTWMQLHENIYNGIVLTNNDGFITYSETTKENTLRGKNRDEFEQMLGNIHEIVKTYKQI